MGKDFDLSKYNMQKGAARCSQKATLWEIQFANRPLPRVCKEQSELHTFGEQRLLLEGNDMFCRLTLSN